LDIETNAV
jgi:hypothetical protein